MKKYLAWIAALMAIMLLLIGTALAGENADADVVAAVDEYARNNINALKSIPSSEDGPSLYISDLAFNSYLRAAFKIDVEASRTALADTEQLAWFEMEYGKYAQVYVLEYACVVEGSLPYSHYEAVGVSADGSMEQANTPDKVTEKYYIPSWYANVVIELVYDVTLTEAGAA